MNLSASKLSLAKAQSTRRGLAGSASKREEGASFKFKRQGENTMKTRLLLTVCAVGTFLALQGMVGCGSDNSGTQSGKGGSGTAGIKGTGGSSSVAGAPGTGGSLVGTGGRGAPGVGGAQAMGGRGGPGTGGEQATGGRGGRGAGGTQAAGGRGPGAGGTQAAGGRGGGTGGSTGTRLDAGPDTGNRDTNQPVDVVRRDTTRIDGACGAEGEACCTPGNTCDDGLTCQGNAGNRTCRPAPDAAEDAPCGSEGEACCANRTCNSADLDCTGNGRNATCEAASNDGGGRRGG
jgi:hypothetical protein